eukprot:760425-Hanusia_phi.AAC.1
MFLKKYYPQGQLLPAGAAARRRAVTECRAPPGQAALPTVTGAAGPRRPGTAAGSVKWQPPGYSVKKRP